MYKWILVFLLIPSVCLSAEINRQNIKPKADYKADGDTFFMVNMICAEENTSLPNVKNNMFIRCNIRNCILDETNTFSKSIYTPEVIIFPDEKTEDEVRIYQLEKFITDNSLIVPIKEVSIER